MQVRIGVPFSRIVKSDTTPFARHRRLTFAFDGAPAHDPATEHQCSLATSTMKIFERENRLEIDVG